MIDGIGIWLGIRYCAILIDICWLRYLFMFIDRPGDGEVTGKWKEIECWPTDPDSARPISNQEGQETPDVDDW